MAINGIKVVDSHVHLLPGRLGEKVRAFFDIGVSPDTPLAYPNDHDIVVHTLHSEGVDEIWTLPYSHKAGVARGLNEASAATVKQFASTPLPIVGGSTVHPDDHDAVEIVRDAIDIHGLRILKLHCSVGSFSVHDPRLFPVYELANERHLPVVVHVGHHVNGLTEAEEIASLAIVAEAFPDMPLIVAHCGHYAAPQTIELMRNYSSIHADLTPVVHAFPNIDAQHISEFSDRILFGSDSPNTTLTVTRCIEWLTQMGHSREVMTAVLGTNAQRLVANVVTN